MVQPQLRPQDPSADVHDRVVLFPTRPPARVSRELPAQPVSRPTDDPQVRIRTRAICQVVVLEIAGRLSDVVQDLDLALQLALAEGPRGVVCDLTDVLQGDDPGAVEILAQAGRHVRDWPGIPVAVACPDPRVREELSAHPLGAHLVVTSSVLSAVSVLLAIPAVAAQWLRLAPHPTAPRAAREFVTRTLVGWGLDALTLSASLVVSELVTSSTMQATTGIDLSVAWSMDSLRLTVRDNSPEMSLPWDSHLVPSQSRRTAVAGLTRTFGVLPAADGGKVVWAILNAARPR